MQKTKKELTFTLVRHLTNITCSQPQTKKQGKLCPTTLNKEICCWFCLDLEACIKKWHHLNYYCKKYNKERWCSAVSSSYKRIISEGK